MDEGILLVDDHPGFRRMARRLLEAGGLRVIGEAADGRQAVALAAELRPEVVVLDVLLPDIDGFAVAAMLAELPDPPAVVLISSHSPLELGAEAGAPNVRGFLPKDELTAQRLAELAGLRP
ncbi:hypothetical protein Ssi03_31080 [Sphaerisporangium siamense]|uniref:DNA-binding NarL/FixJ family response regulator n=1 Tax=Sphaerisporangium siamense TaxID=795645 RepID=A0A7W7GCS9_9ACTN|nr:response regulator transcription factor [Sphaerisporangium siamense]MBB4704200.1 DNA-binding NarL/FixJ family response regulator [Sphaerisporangium siamense]GII85118.1 hypothetical protein Ssi03_31080 [Sphaerisporangium siamense]